MQIIVDIGNTDIVFGLYHQDRWQQLWRYPSTAYEEAESFLQQKLDDLHTEMPIEQVVLSSVVPKATRTIQDVLTRLFKRIPILIGPDLFRRLPMQVAKPDEIGSDLVANAYAAWLRYQSACIVVDFGTALTFTAISHQGHLLGVAIAPGLKTAMYALFSKAAQLPEVPLELPDIAIGTSTPHAIQSGILLGYVGLVKEMLQRFREELKGDGDTEQVILCIATGGLSSVLTPLQQEFDQIDKTLTLDGLRLLGEFAATL